MVRFSMEFVVARDLRSGLGQSELHNREGLFHPFAKASGSFVVACFARATTPVP